MENASKALLIAGAILLAILIISLGIMVYNNARQSVSNANLSEQEIQAFNGKFTSYVGSNKSASEVQSLFQAVYASNATEGKKGTNRYVTIKYTGNSGEETYNYTNTTMATVITSKTYTVSATYSTSGNNAGLITELTVK